MDTKEINLYLDFLSYAFNGGPGHGAEVTCDLDYTKGMVYECVINSPGLGYTYGETFGISGDINDEGVAICYITEVDDDGRVLSFTIDENGIGYTPQTNVLTVIEEDGSGSGLTVDIVSVRYPILRLNIIKPGEKYHTDWNVRR